MKAQDAPVNFTLSFTGRLAVVLTVLFLCFPFSLLAQSTENQESSEVESTGPQRYVIRPSKDSMLRHGDKNTNDGSSTALSLAASGDHRVLIAFDFAGVPKISSPTKLKFAKLRLYVNESGENWGENGRRLVAHRLLSNWTEGNGSNSANIRGSGPGVTWNCATDQNVANSNDDCLTAWDGGTYLSRRTSAKTATDLSDGQYLEFDVTRDVRKFLLGTAPNFGWVIKKKKEFLSGRLEFSSRESTTKRPRLILVYRP